MKIVVDGMGGDNAPKSNVEMCIRDRSYAMKELAKVENDSITEIGKSLSKGSLMGARGNSGVILSQIIRGFSKSIDCLLYTSRCV